jgi:hypothetical protein
MILFEEIVSGDKFIACNSLHAFIGSDSVACCGKAA